MDVAEAIRRIVAPLVAVVIVMVLDVEGNAIQAKVSVVVEHGIRVEHVVPVTIAVPVITVIVVHICVLLNLLAPLVAGVNIVIVLVIVLIMQMALLAQLPRAILVHARTGVVLQIITIMSVDLTVVIVLGEVVKLVGLVKALRGKGQTNAQQTPIVVQVLHTLNVVIIMAMVLV